ncbi:MAG TPA: ABC transporter ATP-binding protein [Methylocella sp.]|nr:ABC transporter ATP-binding protein [Methylocella sp.]
MLVDNIVLEARELTTIFAGHKGFFRQRRPEVRAVDNVSIAVRRGETFGIVGESGCGKTTLARTLLGAVREAAGEIHLESKRVDGMPPKMARKERYAIQYLYQDAAGSLDPWWQIGHTLMEPLIATGLRGESARRLGPMLDAVELDAAVSSRYPHELSGGQLRRVALARVLMMKPKIVILDEPTAGLDLSIQASVLRLLRDLKEKLGLTNLLVSHDLSVVRLMCDRMAVMYLGRVVEDGPTEAIFAGPRHPYTRALLDATPKLLSGPVPESAVGGDIPNLAEAPSGCAFRTRCPHAIPICEAKNPPLDSIATGVRVACHRWRELALEPQTDKTSRAFIRA